MQKSSFSTHAFVWTSILEKKIDMISLVFFRLSINSVAFLAKTFPQSTTSQCCRSLNKESHCHSLVEGKGNLDYQGNFSQSNIFVIVVNAKKQQLVESKWN